jgi:signal transduction histidine kinase
VKQQKPPPPGERGVRRLLIAGFLLMAALLAVDGVVGFQTIVSIRESVSTLIEHQFGNVVLIDEVQRAQASLSSIVYHLTVDPGSPNRQELGRRVKRIEQTLHELFRSIPEHDPDMPIWREVRAASAEVTAEADRLVSGQAGVIPDLNGVIRSRERLLDATARLIRSNHDRAEDLREQIARLTRRRQMEDGSFLTAGLLIACVCAWLVIRTAARLYQKVAEQADELNRVSWQLLEKQESLARRLSHELHDELGQSLTALKTNFSRHAGSTGADAEWIRDCSGLLRDSIRSAHEIAQLLRPTILDDFGLPSALAWLCERFEERNGIEVECRATLGDRLDEQTETHVFRIAQEALTNVARHAHASRVSVDLNEGSRGIMLRITDDGVGLPATQDPARRSFGLTGMRARARSLNGEMTVSSGPGRGTVLEVSFPRREVAHESQNSHLAG